MVDKITDQTWKCANPIEFKLWSIALDQGVTGAHISKQYRRAAISLASEVFEMSLSLPVALPIHAEVSYPSWVCTR